ncbi:hypothetical protein GGR53DRAFT_367388 [Hypoxylon sp. FL1150]|nr:hypothetical protein GGR53DRAFT_367388 [Hypoxylon sp. FL1150]
MSGTCDSGFVFYSCNNGFRGCCSESACDTPDGCPDDAKQPDDPTPTSTTDDASEATPTTTSKTLKPSATMGSIIVTPEPTTDGSRTTIQIATPPLSSPPAQTSSPQGDADTGSPLSTAAIAGICVGGTVLAMFILLIISLRIRRHRIAKRHASSASASADYSDAAFAEDFMRDHPSMSAMRNSQAGGGDIAKVFSR